jgi:hypothetical protein
MRKSWKKFKKITKQSHNIGKSVFKPGGRLKETKFKIPEEV